MNIFIKYGLSVIAMILCFVSAAHATDKLTAYELLYDEQEEGTDIYSVRFIVTERYIRIDDLSDSSGYILYDNTDKKIHSVSHFDKSVLVIPAYEYKKPDMSHKVKIDYNALDKAPKISGKTVYNYRVENLNNDKDVCMYVQLVPGLLPEVTKILTEYQKIVVGQQAKNLVSTPKEFQTTCFLYDQVFNEGLYYSKGLPIQEWHSNGKKRMLTSYKKVEVDPAIFKRSDDYREYSLD